MKTGKYYEVVWTLQGFEQFYGPYNRAFEQGRPRVQKQVHGGSLRIDEVLTESSRGGKRS